jgi:hypothetical protein
VVGGFRLSDVGESGKWGVEGKKIFRFFKEQLPEYDPFKHNIQSAIIDDLQVHIPMAAKVYDAWYCQVEQMMSRC